MRNARGGYRGNSFLSEFVIAKTTLDYDKTMIELFTIQRSPCKIFSFSGIRLNHK